VPADVAQQRTRDAARPTMTQAQRLAERAAPAAPATELSAEQLQAMFPGGVVPKSPPPRTLGSRFRSRRR
jgi:hypothetical protein